MENIWNSESENCYKANYPDWFEKPDYDEINKANYDDIPFPDFLADWHLDDESKQASQRLTVKKTRIQTGHKVRSIFIPDDATKKFFRNLLPELYAVYDKIALKNIAYAFLPGASCVTQAKRHIGFEYTISMDIEDFFDSVRKEHIAKYVAPEKLEYLLIDGAPRQGLPTSPIVSNIALNQVDSEILEALSALQNDFNKDLPNPNRRPLALWNIVDNSFVYTRYADDLSISVNNPKLINPIISKIRTTLNNHGFRLNETKSKILNASNGRRIICGVGVSKDNIHITRKTKKKMRAARHQRNYSSLLGLYSWMNSIETKKSR